MPSGVSRSALALAALGAAAALAAPAGCLFPSYAFDLPGSGGSAASSSSATATATASSSTASSAASSSSGGAGGAPMENCLNGVDDNGDGKVDCEDPECQAGFECVDAVPAGWGPPGYVALYAGDSTTMVPACPADMPNTAYTGNDGPGPPTVCAACGCAAPTGQDCELTQDLDPTKMGIQAMQVSNAGCNMGATQLNTLTVPDPPWGGACYHDEMLPGGQLCNGMPCNTSVTSSQPTVSGGTCAATGGTAGKPPVVWATNARGCTGTMQGKGCPSGQVCMPKLPSPFNPHVCVQQTGDVACPAGSSFSNKSTYYGGFDDGRACTGCTCGPVSGGSCEITLSLWSDPAVGTCNTAVTSFIAGQCKALNGNPAVFGWSDQVTKAPFGGACSPVGASTPTGQVTATLPTTFCCQ